MYKIAIIDDDPDIIEASSLLLNSRGYDVVSAQNVEEALELVPREKPDLIILDVVMVEPDDGFYLANKFRKIGINTPILMLTSIAKVTGYDFGNNESLPIQDFLEKPISPDALLEKIKQYLK
jgi:DNA-binding response OmpR family regulator